MSLVELAIKKMQAATRSQPAVPPDNIVVPNAKLHDSAAELSRLKQGVIGEVITASKEGRGATAAERSVAYRSDKFVRIDRLALRSQGLMPPEQQERALADQYRHIKRPLISRATGHGAEEKVSRGQLIMMASALPGEGKTFTSINLALSMALEKDISVLLVDADVAKPHISRTFGLESEPGLLDVLRDEASDVESMILTTDIPNLCILPAGCRSEIAPELLASVRMSEAMNQLIERDPLRIVLIDSPPLLLTSEASALAQSAGQVVMVVRAGSTSQQAVLDAVAQLGENKHIGLVLNQSTDAPLSGYYYGYPTA